MIDQKNPIVDPTYRARRSRLTKSLNRRLWRQSASGTENTGGP